MGQVDPSLKNAFSDVQKKARDVNKNLRETNRALKLNPSSFELITQKQQYLQQATISTKEKLDQERQALESLRAMPQTEEVIEQQRKLEREIAETESAYKRLRKEAINYYSTAGNRLHQLAGWQKQTGEKLTRMGRSMMSISGPAMAAIGWAGKTTATFDNKMSRVKAITGETGKTFQQMRQYAIKMGNDTVFSASQVADAMSNMGMAGWKFKDMKQGGKSVVDLSAAFGIEPEKATEIVTGNLAALKMPVSQASTLVNQLAAAAANSNTDVLDLGESLKYVGTVAGAFGYSSKDTINALGVMANANIKGSMAGTSLRNILTSMTKDWTFYNDKLGQVTVRTRNADGTMRNFGDVIADLQKKTEGMTKAQKVQLAESIAGKRGMAALLQLMATDPVNMAKNKQLKAALDTANKGGGKAAEMAIERVNNIPGQLTLLKSKLQTAGIQLFDALTPTLLNGLKNINKMLERFNSSFAKMPDWTKNLIAKSVAGVALLGPALIVLGKLHTGLSGISDVLGNLMGKGSLLKDVFLGAGSPAVKALAGEGLLGKIAGKFASKGLGGKIGGALLKGMNGSGIGGKLLTSLAGSGVFSKSIGKMIGLFGKAGTAAAAAGEMAAGSNGFGSLATLLGAGGSAAGGGIMAALKALPIQAKLAVAGVAAAGVGLAVAWPHIKNQWNKHLDKKHAKQTVQKAADKYAQAKDNYDTGVGSKAAMQAAEKSYQNTQRAYTKKYGKPFKVTGHAEINPEDKVKLKKKTKVSVDMSDASDKVKKAAKTGKSAKAKIKITADTSGVSKQLDALYKDVNRVSNRAKKIKAKIDAKGADKQIKNIAKNLKSIKTKKAKVSVHITKTGEDPKKLAKQIDGLSSKTVTAKVKIKQVGGKASDISEMFAYMSNRVVKIGVDTSGAGSKLLSLASSIKSIKSKNAKIKVSISKSGEDPKKIAKQVSVLKNKKFTVKVKTVQHGAKVSSLAKQIGRIRSKNAVVRVQVKGSISSLATLNRAASNVFKSINRQKIKIKKPDTNVAVSAVRRMKSQIARILHSISSIRWKISRPRIPQFHMSGTFNPQTGAVPHISVSWYKSAMQLGAILKKPTIFGIGQNGRMLGAGEAGDEAIVGTSSLYRMVQRAVQSVAQPQEEKPDWLIKSMELQRNPVYINSDSPTPNYADSAANIEMGGITFAPNITMAPSETQPEDVIRALKRYMPQFMDSVETELRRREDGRLVSENAGL